MVGVRRNDRESMMIFFLVAARKKVFKKQLTACVRARVRQTYARARKPKLDVSRLSSSRSHIHTVVCTSRVDTHALAKCDRNATAAEPRDHPASTHTQARSTRVMNVRWGQRIAHSEYGRMV